MSAGQAFALAAMAGFLWFQLAVRGRLKLRDQSSFVTIAWKLSGALAVVLAAVGLALYLL
jgi:hypothetical protein